LFADTGKTETVKFARLCKVEPLHDFFKNSFSAFTVIKEKFFPDLMTPEEKERVKRRDAKSAHWTHEKSPAGHLYYFAPNSAALPPYKKQIRVTAIIDVAEDGTLAGVELIDSALPPPPKERKP
jgi:hypothetical protein